MKFLRIDLLTLLISLFILGSCKNPDSIGLAPSKSVQSNLIDTSTIITSTQRDDSVLTSGASVSKLPLSYFRDPIFGITEANIAASLSLPGSAAYTLPTGTIAIDSAVLVLKYADGFYGDSLNTAYKLNVYQLSEPLVNSKFYYNTKAWSYNASLLGSQTFHPRPNTKVKVYQIVKGAKDTIIKVDPQIRVNITSAFVSANFFGATSSQLGTNSIFQNFINGLYLTLDKSQPGFGGNMILKLGNATSSLDIYYRTTSTANVIDTAVVSLPLGDYHAAQIKHTYTSSVQNHINQQLSDSVYLQGMAGLRAKISFPYLKKLLPVNLKDSDIIVNRAELVVTPIANTNIPFPPAPRLTMYRYDIANQRTLIPDAYAGDPHYILGAFGGYYDAYHKSYHYVITGYVEDLMRGKAIDYGTFIAPADTVNTIDVFNRPHVAARTVIAGGKTSPYRMKLNIIYNKVAK